MKKIVPIFLSAVCLIASNTYAHTTVEVYAATDNYSAEVSGVRIKFNDESAVLSGLRVSQSEYNKTQFVSLRQLAEFMGAEVSFQSTQQGGKIQVTKGESYKKPTSNVKTSAVNANNSEMDIYVGNIKLEGKAYNVNGSLYVPVNSLVYALGNICYADDNGVYTIKEKSGKIVKFDDNDGYFYIHGIGVRDFAIPIELKSAVVDEVAITQKTIYSLSSGIEEVELDAFNCSGIQVIDVNRGYRADSYLLLNKSDMEETKTVKDVVEDSAVTPIDLNGSDINEFFNEKCFYYSNSKATPKRQQTAMDLSCNTYQNEYKVHQQWSTPFIYRDAHDKVYEAVAVLNLLEDSNKNLTLKMDFYKMEDFKYTAKTYYFTNSKGVRTPYEF